MFELPRQQEKFNCSMDLFAKYDMSLDPTESPLRRLCCFHIDLLLESAWQYIFCV